MDIEKIETELEQITKMIWQPNLPAELVRVFNPSPEILKGKTRGGCVHILGQWNGSVSVEGSLPITCWITQRMLALGDAEPAEEDWQSVLKELTNVTGGNIKGLLGHNNILSTPKSFEGNDYNFCVPETPEILRLSFCCDDQVFLVRLHEGKIEYNGQE